MIIQLSDYKDLPKETYWFGASDDEQAEKIMAFIEKRGWKFGQVWKQGTLYFAEVKEKPDGHA